MCLFKHECFEKITKNKFRMVCNLTWKAQAVAQGLDKTYIHSLKRNDNSIRPYSFLCIGPKSPRRVKITSACSLPFHIIKMCQSNPRLRCPFPVHLKGGKNEQSHSVFAHLSCSASHFLCHSYHAPAATTSSKLAVQTNKMQIDGKQVHKDVKALHGSSSYIYIYI